MTSDFLPVLSENLLVVIIAGAILLLLGVCAGYYIGNVSLYKGVQRKLDRAAKEGLIHKQIINNVGLGVIVYGKEGVIYANKTIEQLPGFLRTQIPADIESFLTCYDKENQLKSNYILGIQNGINTTRANYYVDNKVYEIKILRKMTEEDEQLEIVIIEDITQIKDNEKRQKDLAANVSHELKTPMTVLWTADSFFDVHSPEEMPDYDTFRNWGARLVQNCHRMQDIIDDFVLEAHEKGLQVSMHNIGDRATERLLTAFEKACSKYPRPNHRHRFEHFSMATDDQARRALDLGCCLAMQPSYVVGDQMIRARVGEDRMKRSLRFKTFMDIGLKVGGGSDAPVTPIDPFHGIACCMEHFLTEERLGLFDAVKMFTSDAAYLTFEEGVRGSLSVGKFGDIVICDRNVREINNASELRDVKINCTIVGGEIKYSL